MTARGSGEMKRTGLAAWRWALAIAGGALAGVAYSFVSQALGST